MRYEELNGEWQVKLSGQEWAEQPAIKAVLPGTLDENKIGGKDENREQWHPDVKLESAAEGDGQNLILTRYTRNYSYEGPAHFSKTLAIARHSGERVFLEVERTRKLTCRINDQVVPEAVPGTASTPYVFELTGFLAGQKEGGETLTLTCDNSYPGWPRKPIVFSSAATDETQTNWNGLLGFVRLRREKSCFIPAVRVYPSLEQARIVVELDCGTAYEGVIRLSAGAFKEMPAKQVSLPAGRHEVVFEAVAFHERVRFWDEGEGNLYELKAAADHLDEITVRFGIRLFGNQEGKLALNHRPIFLRSESNCCVFPETGHMPLEAAAWREILLTYRAYGVNCLRFHSHCPPEAAFAAADEQGMLMQPELSHWNAHTAFEDEESWSYYQLELKQILLTFANHPSFVMLSFGNELKCGELGHKRMDQLLRQARELDCTRLYLNASNCHYGEIGADPESDFYTAMSYYDEMIRGTSPNLEGYINHQYPCSKTNFDGPLDRIRQTYQKPVFSFEVGQYEVLPDFDELEEFHGVLRPDNLLEVKKKVQTQGFAGDWKRRVEATGELSLLAYREEVEAVLRTPRMSGISLLGLQDFPGQGTALVGMLNSHLKPKPFDFARPKRFSTFFADTVMLVLLERYTYTWGQTLTAEIKMANYSKADFTGACIVRLSRSDGECVQEIQLPERNCGRGQLSVFGRVSICLKPEALGTTAQKAERLMLTAVAGDYLAEYPIWVYPDRPCYVPAGIVLTASGAEAKTALSQGRKVFYTPAATKENFPHSIKIQFTTDFWSVGTFPKQEGFMGCYMDPAHPVFREFPTEFHSNWQWWAMCQGRAMILPKAVTPLITGLDCYAKMRHLGLLAEGRCGRGKLMVSSMGLLEWQHYPEVNALINSILQYMDSDEFAPEQELAGVDEDGAVVFVL